MLESISINWKLMGAKLARLSDNEQVEFFTGFVKEMQAYESNQAAQMQLCYVNHALKEDVREWMRDNLGCLWIDEDGL